MSFTIGRWTFVVHEAVWDDLVSCIAADNGRSRGAVTGWPGASPWPDTKACATVLSAIDRAKRFPEREVVEMEVDDLHQVGVVFRGLGAVRRSRDGIGWISRYTSIARRRIAQAVQADVVEKLAQLDGDRFRLVL